MGPGIHSLTPLAFDGQIDSQICADAQAGVAAGRVGTICVPRETRETPPEVPEALLDCRSPDRFRGTGTLEATKGAILASILFTSRAVCSSLCTHGRVWSRASGLSGSNVTKQEPVSGVPKAIPECQRLDRSRTAGVLFPGNCPKKIEYFEIRLNAPRDAPLSCCHSSG